jgi:hypothetical protein
MAAVLLRVRLDPTRGIDFQKLSPVVQKQLKASLLIAFSQEKSKPVGKKICHVMGQIAETCAENGFRGWPEVLPAVFQLAQSGDATGKETALFLFKQLVSYGGAKGVQPHSAQLQPILGHLLTDLSPGVASGALQGTAAVIAILEQDADRQPYLVLMPSILKALERTLSTGGDETAAQEALRALTEVVEAAPAFMRAYMEPAAQAMLAIIQHDQFEEE